MCIQNILETRTSCSCLIEVLFFLCHAKYKVPLPHVLCFLMSLTNPNLLIRRQALDIGTCQSITFSSPKHVLDTVIRSMTECSSRERYIEADIQSIL